VQATASASASHGPLRQQQQGQQLQHREGSRMGSGSGGRAAHVHCHGLSMLLMVAILHHPWGLKHLFFTVFLQQLTMLFVRNNIIYSVLVYHLSSTNQLTITSY